MRVALVHDWLTGMRGGERVLEALLELFPRAEIFTLLHEPGSVSAALEARPIRTSFLDRIPGARRAYRWLLPWMPRAVASLDVRGFDLVVSSSHCVAKGIPVPPGVPHLCYCHTPMRYVWDQYEAYWGPGRAPAPVRAVMRRLAPRLRRWDLRTAERVDRFVANSTWVRGRIERCWGRSAAVVHPPVALGRFRPATEDVADGDLPPDLVPPGPFWLVLGAAAPYKRVDLAVAAFRGFGGRRLVVAGPGTDRAGLRRLAGPGTTFLGRVPDPRAAALLRHARGLLQPGVEDFGIVTVEALASGTPVVALGRGGVRDIVHPAGAPEGPATGVFFDEPTVDALRAAVLRAESIRFEPARLAASARRFGRERFLREMRVQVEAVLESGAGALAP